MRLSRPTAVLAAALAAPIAHVAIDVLGDRVLAHDDYDDVTHASRLVAVLLVLAVAGLLAAVVGVLGAREARRHGAPLRAFLGSLAPRSVARFAAAAAAITPAFVGAMGLLDAHLAGGGATFASVFAGAPLFALALGAFAGATIGIATGAGLRRLARASGRIVCIVAAILADPRGSRGTVLRIARRAAVPARAAAPGYGRRRRGRAPPFTTR